MKKKIRKSNIGVTWVVFLAFIVMMNKYNMSFDLFIIKWINGFIVALAAILLFITLKAIIKFLIVKKKKKTNRLKYLKSGISVVDTMKGIEFEAFLLAHFEALGYKGRLTNATNDYGADLLLEKNNQIIVVQAKRYSSKVGIKAIQELVASLQYYNANVGIVVTNNYFTKNAINLAKVNSIELWDRKILIDIMNKNGVKDLASGIINKTSESKICPECSGKLIIKTGTYGEFYGCSNYPKCRFTRKIG